MATHIKTGLDGVYNSVSYRLLDKDGKVTRDHKGEACFSTLFCGSIHENETHLEFYHRTEVVPFDIKQIETFVSCLNELGFPCSVKVSPKEALTTFILGVKDYKHKLHFLSTMMLVRLMTEKGMIHVGDHFLQALDADPKGDKFKLLVDAHHEANCAYLNTWHMTTFKGQGRVADIKALFAQFEAADMPIHYKGRGAKGGSAVNSAWNGSYVAVVKDKPAKKAKKEEEVEF